MTSGVQFTVNTGGAGYGLTGVYNPAAYQSIWSMGPTYCLTPDGNTGTNAGGGNMYGMFYTHDYLASYKNVSGHALRHGVGHMEAGVANWFLGCDGAWIKNTIWGGSNITAVGEITAYSSDKRLKTNIRPITNALSKVVSLNGVIYNWNDIAGGYGFDQTVDVAGLFAQEVEAVLPEAVKLAPFDNENGNSKSGEDYKTIQYEKLVPLLVEAIKEQQIIIDKQQTQINQILARLDTMNIK
jgi:hypothetical protein